MPIAQRGVPESTGPLSTVAPPSEASVVVVALSAAEPSLELESFVAPSAVVAESVVASVLASRDVAESAACVLPSLGFAEASAALPSARFAASSQSTPTHASPSAPASSSATRNPLELHAARDPAKQATRVVKTAEATNDDRNWVRFTCFHSTTQRKKYQRPDTNTGDDDAIFCPSPSSPTLPRPAHFTTPRVVSAHENSDADETLATGVDTDAMPRAP